MPRYQPVQLWNVRKVQLIESNAPVLPAAQQVMRDEVWEKATETNPTLFDGPIALCTDLVREDPDTVTLTWARATYRHFALRSVAGAAPLPAIFVAVVQQTREGGILVGRASSTTAVPFRLELPGGSIEPPEKSKVLDMEELAGQAAREFSEEIGIYVRPTDLSLCAITKTEHTNVGIIFRAPVLAEAVIHTQFNDLQSVAEKTNRNVEIAEIYFLRSSAELAEIDGPRAYYLAQVIDLSK